MLLDENDFRPFRILGFFLVGSAIFGFVFFADSLRESAFSKWFTIITGTWYLATGLGILSRKIWGFYLLKLFLYILILGFPIGTWIGIKSLRYIEEKQIVNFFKGKSLKL